MSCTTQRVPMPWILVAVGDTTEIAIPASAWIPSAGVRSVRTNMEMRGNIGGRVLSVRTGYQTCNVLDTVDSATALTNPGAQTADGVDYGTFEDISSAIAGKQFIRAVWLVKRTTSTGLVTAAVGGLLEVMG